MRTFPECSASTSTHGRGLPFLFSLSSAGIIIRSWLPKGNRIAMYHSTGLMLPRDHYLSTFPLSLCAFSFALDNAGFGNKSMAAAIGQRYSSYIYMYHPLVISLFSSIPWLSQNKLYVSIQPIVVFTATTACIILIQGLYSVIQKTRQRPIS